MVHLPARLPAAVRALRERRVRVRLAAALLAFAAAGLYASSQAAAQGTASAPGSPCDGQRLRWGYEVTLVPGSDNGFSIDGIRMDQVPAECLGHPVEIRYSAGDSVVRTAVAPLALGVIDRVDRSALGSVVVTAASWAPAS